MATNTTNNQYKAKIYLTYSQRTNSYNFAFDYISKYYVKVRINNNEELTYGTHYTVADKTVTLNSVVTLSEGDLIEIFRETPTDKTVEWYDSSILRAQDLNLFNVQLMHINEENMDKLLDSGLQEDKLNGKWDARLKPIKNLANATEDDEAINYGFLKSTQNGYLQASQAKVDEATSKARDAMIQADRAYAQAEIAKQNSTNANNEANRAYSEAERAKGYADKAKTSEDNVSNMKTSVEATKTEVDNIKKAVEATGTASVNAIKNAQAAATADVDSHKASAVRVIDEYTTTFASYRDAAATSATNASNSAANADNSATNAATKASQASTSATNAANSATNAANSATEAKTYKDQAKAIVGGDFATRGEMTAYVKDVTVNNSQLVITKGNGNLNVVTPDYAIASMQTKPKDLGGFTGKTLGALRDILLAELDDMQNIKTRYIKFGANIGQILTYWGTNWDVVFTAWGTISCVITKTHDTATRRYAKFELNGFSDETVILLVRNEIWELAEKEVRTINGLNRADTWGLSGTDFTFDFMGSSTDQVLIGGNTVNYLGSGFKYLFKNGKGNYADIYADEYYGTFRGKAMVGGITQTVDLNNPYTDTYSKKLEVTGSGTANNLPYKYNFIMTLKSNTDIAQLAIPVSSNARISVRCLPNQANNNLVGAWLEIPYLRDIQPIAAAEVAKIVNSAPETLNTLNELANALGNDPNFATTVTKMISQKADKTAVDNIVNVMYPVGIIVEFATDVDPNTVWQGTTWERMPAGRVLISAGQYSESDYSHNYTLGETGGEATHQLTADEMPSHNHHGWTGNNGQHSHTYNSITQGKDQNAGSGGDNYWDTNTTSSAGNHNHEFTTDNTGGNGSHNNVQPYNVVSRWKRTA